jgi:hypothetical protein
MNGDAKAFANHSKKSYKTYRKNVKMYAGKPLSFDEWLRMYEDDILHMKEKMILDKRNYKRLKG